MAVSPHIASLRARVGHDLLLLPAVAVLPVDDAGRILLVRQADTMAWSTIGGAIEPDESPEDAAVREALEEAGVEVRLTGVRAVLGGPEFRVRYPNGDTTSYVTIVFDAVIVSGKPQPDGDETVAASWYSPAALPTTEMTDFTRALLRGVGVLGG